MTKILSYDFLPLYKREGNWAKLAFAMTSGIVTGEAPVSYWPIFFLVPINGPSSLSES